MMEAQWRSQLQSEGFGDIYIWRDGPGVEYLEHGHRALTAHVVLAGSIEITINDENKIYKEGDRFDVPAGKTHTAKVGGEGCTYLIAE